MNEEREMILRMLKEGKISAEEADALLQELRAGNDDPVGSSDAPPDVPTGMPDLRAELRGIFDNLVASIPQEVTRELRRAKDLLRPNLWGALHALRDLKEGQAESTVEHPMTAGDRLVVRNAWGDVQIVRSSGALRVKALRRVWTAAEDPQQIAQSLEVMPRRSNGEVTIDIPPVKGRRVRVDLHLEVPDGVAVTLRLTKGDVNVSQISGPLDVQVVRGDIQSADLQSTAAFAIASGDLEVGSTRGDVSLDIRSGDVALKGIGGVISGRVLSGDVAIRECRGVRLDVIHGDVSIDEASGAVSVEGESGDISVTLAVLPDDEAVSLRTMSGDINLSLPEHSRATIDAAVTSGEVDCEVPLQDRQGDRRRLRGMLNGPGAAVTLRTTSGDIDIGSKP